MTQPSEPFGGLLLLSRLHKYHELHAVGMHPLDIGRAFLHRVTRNVCGVQVF